MKTDMLHLRKDNMVRLFLVIACFICMASCNNEKNSVAAEAGVDSVSSMEKQQQEAIQKYPDSILLKENLIQYYRENGNYENALVEVNRALQRDSSNARLWDIKAILHAENEDTVNAISSFEQALEITPLPEYVISLGTLYAQTKNRKALEMADALIVADKSKADKEAIFIKGLYYASINEKEKAIGYFDKCIAINYSFVYAYREKCLALYDLRRYKEALDVINRAITLQNSYEEGYFYAGKCLQKLNRIDDAVAAYQRALLYAPDYVEAKEALAQLGIKT